MENKSQNDITETPYQKATFAAGCFWGVEATFMQLDGVKSTMVGYCGGNYSNPTYKDVCSGNTGYAEAVEVVYDPQKISYNKLLEVFWTNHNPTTPNRQGPDFGTQYRSVIFYHSEEQKKIAEESKAELEKNGKYKNKIVTQIVPAKTFFKAEEYHQQYLKKKGLLQCH